MAVGGREVNRIGLGMSPLARKVAGGGDREAAVALLRRALELGVDYYDTARFYGGETANELLREAFGDLSEVFVATKVGARPVTGRFPMTAAQLPAELRREVEENLRSLGTDRLDLVFLRRMDFLPGLVAEGEQGGVSLEDQLAELVALREAGKIGAIGLSHVTTEQVRAGLDVGIAAVQNIDNLAYPQARELRELCGREQIAWIPYFPLGGGAGVGQATGLTQVRELPAVREVAAELGATPTQVGLAWHLAENPTTVAITGTGSVEHLEENLATADLRLTAEQKARLDAAAG